MSRTDIEYSGLSHALDRLMAAQEALAAAAQHAGGDIASGVAAAASYARAAREKVLEALEAIDKRQPAERGDGDSPRSGVSFRRPGKRTRDEL